MQENLRGNKWYQNGTSSSLMPESKGEPAAGPEAAAPPPMPCGREAERG
jgi:hypothetical protein